MSLISGVVDQYRQKQQALEPQVKRLNREISLQSIRTQTSTQSFERHKAITRSLSEEQSRAGERRVRLLKQAMRQAVEPSAEIRAEHTKAKRELSQINDPLATQRTKQRVAVKAKAKTQQSLEHCLRTKRRFIPACAGNAYWQKTTS